ncbi:hypothetical protein TNCV_2338731 [Trichonephila clavipes]|nr:hypothetical protein TNCV_2338731 [Trichonephila clavipes]
MTASSSIPSIPSRANCLRNSGNRLIAVLYDSLWFINVNQQNIKERTGHLRLLLDEVETDKTREEPDEVYEATSVPQDILRSIKRTQAGKSPVTGSSRFLLIVLLGSLGPKRANSFQPNPEAKRDYAN